MLLFDRRHHQISYTAFAAICLCHTLFFRHAACHAATSAGTRRLLRLRTRDERLLRGRLFRHVADDAACFISFSRAMIPHFRCFFTATVSIKMPS